MKYDKVRVECQVVVLHTGALDLSLQPVNLTCLYHDPEDTDTGEQEISSWGVLRVMPAFRLEFKMSLITQINLCLPGLERIYAL